MNRYITVQFSAVEGSSGKANAGQILGWVLHAFLLSDAGAFERIATWLTGWVRDDMDAATRWRFA